VTRSLSNAPNELVDYIDCDKVRMAMVGRSIDADVHADGLVDILYQSLLAGLSTFLLRT